MRVTNGNQFMNKLRADCYHSVQKEFDLPFPTNSQEIEVFPGGKAAGAWR